MKVWINAARLYVVGASVLPALLGVGLAWRETGAFRPVLFLLTMIGVALIHVGSNLINDYFDFKSGVDMNNPDAMRPFSGGSTVLTDGIRTPEQVKRAALLCYAAAAIIGLALTAICGLPVLAIGLFGILTGYAYVHPKIHLLNLGVGEVVVGLDFGVLTVAGAYYVQAHSYSLSAFAVSLPVALLISMILIINEFPDYAGDKAGGKRTLVVRLGRAKAAKLLVGLFVVTGVMLAALPLLGFLPIWGLSALLAFPFALLACRTALKSHEDIPRLVPANIGVIQSHTFVNSFLCAACLCAGGALPFGLAATALVLVWEVATLRQLRRAAA